MTWSELIGALTPEKMPTVEWQGMRGVVTEIKHNNMYKGITVKFSHVNFGTWFWDGVSTDKRSKDISVLKLVDDGK